MKRRPTVDELKTNLNQLAQEKAKLQGRLQEIASLELQILGALKYQTDEMLVEEAAPAPKSEGTSENGESKVEEGETEEKPSLKALN